MDYLISLVQRITKVCMEPANATVYLSGA